MNGNLSFVNCYLLLTNNGIIKKKQKHLLSNFQGLNLLSE